jgi:uncharacterized protein (DUF2147 family)
MAQDGPLNPSELLSVLDWYRAAGVDIAVGEEPVNRFAQRAPVRPVEMAAPATESRAPVQGLAEAAPAAPAASPAPPAPAAVVSAPQAAPAPAVAPQASTPAQVAATPSSQPKAIAAATPARTPAPATPAAAVRPAPTVAAAAAPPPVATTPVGIWRTEDNKGNVRIEQCGADLCGYAVGSGEKILINMKPRASKWIGRIHDPHSGRNYDSSIAMKGPNRLKVRGCAFGGLFCGGQTWKRVS